MMSSRKNADEHFLRANKDENTFCLPLHFFDLLIDSFEIWWAVIKVREGELGNEFFIVIDGTADVTQNCAGNIKKVGQLGPRYAYIAIYCDFNLIFSDYFGELALILDRPRAATVTAKTYMRVSKQLKLLESLFLLVRKTRSLQVRTSHGTSYGHSKKDRIL